jgi:gas vesicle protein
MANNRGGGASFILGMLVGGAVGAAIGMMMAPKSGPETRADLAERSEMWRTVAEELAASLRERARPAMDTAMERINPAVEVVRERVNPVVEQVTSRIGRGNDGRHVQTTESSPKTESSPAEEEEA